MPQLTGIDTTCCIVGGGPAGMMLGFLLARAGVDVEVLEKHGDFLRDFRGDTVHPSTLELMHELGVLSQFLERPHQKVSELGAQFGGEFMKVASFSGVRTKCKYIALMPQWEFLDFIAQEAGKCPSFSLRMNTEALDLIKEKERIVGVVARDRAGELHIRARLVVGADGRGSIVREKAGLVVEDLGAPMDVLWMRLSRKPEDPPQTMGCVVPGLLFVMINRGQYWQCGFIVPKGSADKVRQDGLERFRARIACVAPFTADRLGELASWDDVKLLTVRVDRLKTWHRQGLLCIGDAAHAMSPIGGVGINLAVQDAVAAANFLWKPLARGICTQEDLARVEKWRSYPTRMTQGLQLTIQRRFVRSVLGSTESFRVPWLFRFLSAMPAFRSLIGHVIGIGFRPEHILSPKA